MSRRLTTSLFSSVIEPRDLAFSARSILDRVRNITSEKLGGLIGYCDLLTLVACTILAAGLVIYFFAIIAPWVMLRADLLMWEETDFVGNMIKLNNGVSIYTDPSDNNSLIYNPASFFVTYSIAWIFGATQSIPFLRVIQLAFTVCSAVVATSCVYRLRRLAFPGVHQHRSSGLWLVFTFLVMFLVATSPNANRFVYALHVDSLALLVSMVCFWSILRYGEAKSFSSLVLICGCIVVAFLTKQFLVSWSASAFIFILFVTPEPRRIFGFLIIVTTFLGLAIGTCYLLWGDNYWFWAFEVMGGVRREIAISPDHTYGISLARSFDHLLRLWLELSIGAVGAKLLLHEKATKASLGIVSAWVVLVAAETLSSGAGWGLLYHFGPGVLIGAILLFAALPIAWYGAPSVEGSRSFWFPVVRTCVSIVVVVAMLSALQVMPSGLPGHPRAIKALQRTPDLSRYVGEIEAEFQGEDANEILLGVGNWVYLSSGVVQRDRAVSIADQPFGNIYENVDIAIERIRAGKYKKILLQNYDSGRFFYEWEIWPRPAGFRAAIEENYREVRRIKPPEGNPSMPFYLTMGDEVVVFVRRDDNLPPVARLAAKDVR